MNFFYFLLLCMLVGNKPPTVIRQVIMNFNKSDFTELQSLILWTVHSQPPDDPSLSCYMLNNNTWFCTDNYVLHSLVDNDDSY